MYKDKLDEIVKLIKEKADRENRRIGDVLKEVIEKFKAKESD